MKKTLFFLSCLLFLLAGCSQNELDQVNISGDTNSQSGKIRWYGAKLPEGTQLRGVSDGSKRWNQDAGIYIKFINSPSDTQIIEKIKQVASQWEEYAGIKFHFVEQDKNADVRIAFDWNNNDWLTWSYTGNDAKSVTDQSQPTAVFGGIEYLDDTEFNGDVLRLFGQILGLEYEQRHQQWALNGYWKDASQLQVYWEDQFEGYDLDWEQIRQYVFDPLTAQSANQLLETDDIDELSIMVWPYYNRKQTTNLLANYELSEGDKTFIARLYPKASSTLYTIQEAWVNPGYFTWTDETRTALRITELGAQQVYLPDVSDGEQLTSATYMFFIENETNSSLTKAPLFNASNVTDFSYMFYECNALTTIPAYDTSKGVNFSNMFGACLSLASIPQLNTSKGTDFSYMFLACHSLTTIPLLDTSSGTDFSGMFYNCINWLSIPELNTSKGIYFRYMFTGCRALASIPLLNTSNGIDFNNMFSSCDVLSSIPALNTSKGTNFFAMFSMCKTLAIIPNLDTTNGTHFSNMFYGCKLLTAIPSLNTSKGVYFSSMFYECESLTTIPKLDTSNGTDFNIMFQGCKSLVTIPLIDTSKGYYFNAMFKNCISLIFMPAINTSKGAFFSDMFFNCSSLTSKPQLDLSNAIITSNMYAGTPFE